MMFDCFSQKRCRAALRKQRRKRKRQALAQAREVDSNGAVRSEDDSDINNDAAAEEERQRQHDEWLERERIAQEVFRMQAEREEAAKNRKEEEERRIKEEWESHQRKEKEEKDQMQQKKRDREDAVQKMLDEAENQLENGGPWMNPEAPKKDASINYGTERDVANCPFFLKTGACRFGDRCSRKHTYPTTSPTLMVRGMFVTFGMEESRRDDYDIDACLEHSEEDLRHSFLEFYQDVLPEFRSIGKVVQFKVSCNYEPHLKGNVYVQFETEEHCAEAFMKFNGRWYAGKQLHCEICPVTRWKNAICGLFDRQKCSKGKHCNFLHVFRNPGNEFWEADRDLSPNRDVRGSRRDGWHSERYGDRSWRQQRYSRSPVRSERRSRRSRERRSRSIEGRSRSRDRKSRSRDRKSRSRDRKSRRSRSRERSSYQRRAESRSSPNSQYSERRSRYGDRSRSRSRHRHRDGEDKSRSKERDQDSETPREERLNSRGRSKEVKRKQSSERSFKSEKSATHGRHKHSKKSKKKSKKKHKRKSLSPDGKTSTGDSEEEIVEDQSTQGPKEDCVSRQEPAEKNDI